MIRRARAAGCRTFMVTGSDLPNSERAVELAKQYRTGPHHPEAKATSWLQSPYHRRTSWPERLPSARSSPLQARGLTSAIAGTCFATVGMHPCSARSLDAHPGGAPALLGALRTLATTSGSSPSVAAFGEIGLDYDRLGLCDAPTQRRAFEAQLDLAVELQLPLFLHSRAAAADFEALLKPRLAKLPKRGLVHSFTGTAEEMRAVLDMGLDVGVNGCSLKTEENLDVVREVPLDRLQIETDGPWVSACSGAAGAAVSRAVDGVKGLIHAQCEMRPSHASAAHRKEAPPLPKAVKKEKWDADAMVKGRNEPCTIAHVAHVVASVKGIPVEEVCEA